MPISILSANVLNSVSDAEKLPALLNKFEEIADSEQIDMGVFAEAYDPNANRLEDRIGHTTSVLKKNGFKVVHGLYDDTDGRLDTHGIVGFCRSGDLGIVRLADSRNAVRFDVKDSVSGANLSGIGMHADDRSPWTRAEHVVAAIESLPDDGHRVIFGDLNSMPRWDARGRFVGSLGVFTSRMTAHYPTVNNIGEIVPVSKLNRKVNQLVRTVDMARDDVLDLLADAGFEDSDILARPTCYMGRIAIGQLDHIMHSSDVLATRTKIHNMDGISDHRAITTKLNT